MPGWHKIIRAKDTMEKQPNRSPKLHALFTSGSAEAKGISIRHSNIISYISLSGNYTSQTTMIDLVKFLTRPSISLHDMFGAWSSGVLFCVPDNEGMRLVVS